MRLIDFFDRAVDLYPDRVFVAQDAVALSYGEAAGWTHRIAVALASAGFAPGSRIGLYTANDWRGLLAIFGLFRAGCVMTPVNARNAIPQNIETLQTLGVEALFYHSDFAAEAAAAAAACPGIRLLVCLDQAQDGRPALADWMAPTGSLAAEIAQDPQDLWALYATSGTTGRPKGVPHTHLTNLVTSMDMLLSMGVTQPVRHLVVAPMTHFAGTFLFALTVTGSTHVLLAKPDPQAILRALERERIQILFLPPTLIYRLLAEETCRDFDYGHLQRFVYAAAPMAEEKLREAIAVFGPVMMNMFGQAEALGPISFLPPEDHRPEAGAPWDERLRSIGRASYLRRVAVMDEAGAPLPPGEIGEVVLRSWGVTPGYLDQTEATVEAFRQGWYHTGDLGRADAAGYVTLVDRKKDMIVSGGFNIYSAEVERALLAHPAVLEAAVIGVPHETWGEAVKAFVELKPGQAATPEDLIAKVREQLGGVKTPKGLEIWESLPRNATGKVLKQQIRAPYWEGRARKV
ncbi:MAG: AMP-binding protein [Rhodospirillales bacterium]